jgi:hypothetical protein
VPYDWLDLVTKSRKLVAIASGAVAAVAIIAGVVVFSSYYSSSTIILPLLSPLLISLEPLSEAAGVESSNINSTIPTAFPPETNQYGLTYGEWTAKWWQWALSIPEDKNPVTDETGAHCMEGQSGDVWFLAGSFGGMVERVCEIPAGKAILFPLMNSECSFAESPDLTTESELRSCAISSNDGVTELMTTIDGVVMKESDLRNSRVQSPLFDVNFPEGNIFGVTAGPTQAVSDGYWVFLSPLSPGNHEIHFRGATVDFTIESTNNFVTESKYHVAVVE